MQCKTSAAGFLTLLFAAEMASGQARIMPTFRSNVPASITVTPGERYPAAITDLPYSGDRVTEKTLSDGTHMARSVVRVFRDSLGRRREEYSGQGFGSLTIVEIMDPVAGFDWVLDPANQTAYRMVREKTSRPGSRELYPCEPAGQPITTQTIPNGNVTTSQALGSRTIEGIEACGRRTATVQKDGKPGITSELWVSRGDISEIVMNRTSDLQGGNSVTQLVGVRFSEPDPGLFDVPAQFRVIDETAAFTITESAVIQQTSLPVPAPANRTFVALTGLPWSGDVINGTTLLASQARDSMGRTRRENQAISTVTIVDPVVAYSYTLDTKAHTVHRQRITVQSKPASDASTPVATRSGTQTMPSGVIALTESLGAKTIDDVVAYGTRVTLTYPPGTMNGNDKTTSTMNENWFSPKLGASLTTQSSGALVPNSTSRLTNLKFAEPDPALFRVPDDYQVIDDK